jgi:hypothetical protein
MIQAKNRIAMVVITLLVLGVFSCQKQVEPLPIQFFESTFELDTDGWIGDVADYKEGQLSDLNFKAIQAPLPEESTTNHFSSGLYLSANNLNDSIFIYIKKKITDLDTSKRYKVAYEIQLATHLVDTLASSGRISYIKAGATSDEPVSILKNQWQVPSVLHGTANSGGKEMLLLGNLGNGLDSTAYKNIIRTNPNVAIEVKPSPEGVIWLCVGISSRYKGNIPLYFQRIFAAVSEKSAEPI